jgi:hypothetical protein
MYDAFISYSRADLPAVQDLERRLAERGLRSFLDVTSLRAGEYWPPQLGRAMQNSRLVVLCWSARAAASDWVRLEVHLSISATKPVRVLPWLLDSAPLLPELQGLQGIPGPEPARVVTEVLFERWRHHRRMAATLGAGVVILAPVLWFSPRFFTRQSKALRGHIVDEKGDTVADATIEVDGVRADTNSSGEFALVLSGPPARRTLKVTVSKRGFRRRTIDTQSDVPDLGIVLLKDK